MKNKISILECTIRDGSYLIDYQFTAEDTYIICTGLVRAGFKFIEIGHGTGLRSSKVGKGKAAATDEEYLEAAQSALNGTDAQFGMFFIPGIGEMEDLDRASQFGMTFVRIGTNVTEIDQAKPYIERGKSLGMSVSSNLMKSYAVPLDEFIKLAKKADEYGVDVITIVDSAGGMFPEEISEYVLRLKDITDKKIGFHGHNNLQLAMANTLEAIRSGATVVDSSLQGMGRSAGNTQTEVLVMCLEKLGYQTGIDTYMTMDLGERVIKPMMNREQGVDDMSIVAGIAQFHSSFSMIIDNAAQKYKVDPRMLIMEVSKINRINVTQELAEETAKKIKEKLHYKSRNSRPTIITTFIKQEKSDNSIEQAKKVAENMKSRSKKTGKESVFSLTLSQKNKTTFPFIRESASFVIGNCETRDLDELLLLMSLVDGEIDWILVDESCPQLQKQDFDKHVKNSRFTWYSECRALRLSLCTLISQKRPEGMILLCCEPDNAHLIQLSLKQQGIKTIFPSHIFSENININHLKDCFHDVGAIISFGKDFAENLREEHIHHLREKTQIYAARPNAYTESFWNAAREKGLEMFRIDSRCGFASELSLVIETHKLVNSMGISTIAGFPIVSGGAIAPWGTVVVDSIRMPSQVVGIADGLGGLLFLDEESQFKNTMEKVKAQIIEKSYFKEF